MAHPTPQQVDCSDLCLFRECVMLGLVCMLVHMLLHVHATNQFSLRWIEVGDTFAGTLVVYGMGFDTQNCT